MERRKMLPNFDSSHCRCRRRRRVEETRGAAGAAGNKRDNEAGAARTLRFSLGNARARALGARCLLSTGTFEVVT